jgi:hypothetical protein
MRRGKLIRSLGELQKRKIITNTWHSIWELWRAVTRTEQAICRRSAQFQASSCGICGVQSSIAKGFSPGTSVSPCQYLSTNSPYSFTHLSLTIYNLSNGVSFNKTFHSVTDTSNLGLSVDKISVSIYCVLFYDVVTSSGYKKSNGMFS